MSRRAVTQQIAIEPNSNPADVLPCHVRVAKVGVFVRWANNRRRAEYIALVFILFAHVPTRSNQ
jgi:hypothetical protein